MGCQVVFHDASCIGAHLMRMRSLAATTQAFGNNIFLNSLVLKLRQNKEFKMYKEVDSSLQRCIVSSGQTDSQKSRRRAVSLEAFGTQKNKYYIATHAMEPENVNFSAPE